MWKFRLVFAIIMSYMLNEVVSKNQYWWLNNPSIFGSDSNKNQKAWTSETNRENSHHLKQKIHSQTLFSQKQSLNGKQSNQEQNVWSLSQSGQTSYSQVNDDQGTNQNQATLWRKKLNQPQSENRQPTWQKRPQNPKWNIGSASGVAQSSNHGQIHLSPNNNKNQQKSWDQTVNNDNSRQESTLSLSENKKVLDRWTDQIETECSKGTACVNENFCDINGFITKVEIILSFSDKKKRGKINACMNPETRNIGVCCSFNNRYNNSSLVENKVSDSCPIMKTLPLVENCGNAESQCWSVGQPDTDCEGNALCCFDGCINACYYASKRIDNNNSNKENGGYTQKSQSDDRRNQNSASFNSFQDQIAQQEQQQNKNEGSIQQQEEYPKASSPSRTDSICPDLSREINKSVCTSETHTCWKTGQRDDCQNGHICCFDGCVKTCMDANGKFLHHPNSQRKYMNEENQVTPLSILVQEHNVKQTGLPNIQSQNKQDTNLRRQETSSGSQSNNGRSSSVLTQQNRRQQNYQLPTQHVRKQGMFQNQQSEAEPFIKCPAATKCVKKYNCDFNGVMTSETINLSPYIEQRRVPLNPCINFATNEIDVCCRDPNYRDPWPLQNQ